MTRQERKARAFFTKNKEIYDKYEGDFEEFFHALRNKWRLLYREHFSDFDAYIDEMTKDEDETENDSSAELEQSDIKLVIEEELEPVNGRKFDRESLRNELHACTASIATKTVEYLRDEFDKLLKAWIDESCNDYLDKSNKDDKERFFRLESKAITDFYNVLISLKEHIEKTYRTQLWKKDLWYPRKWMLDDPTIDKLIRKYRICVILNELEKRNKQKLKSEKPFIYLFMLDEPKYQGRHPYACFITSPDFYNLILPELKIKKITLQKYLLALCHAGVIVKIDKAGSSDVKKNEILYAIGYLTNFSGSKNKLNRFLTQKNKNQFKNFKLP